MRSSDPDMGHYRRAPGAYDILRRPRALRRGSRSLNADVRQLKDTRCRRSPELSVSSLLSQLPAQSAPQAIGALHQSFGTDQRSLAPS